MSNDVLTEADIIAGEAYQIIGDLALAANLYDHPEVQRALDWFSGFKPGITYKDDASILPWPTTELEAPLAGRVKELEDVLESIDAVGCDFGHFEAAARTMQEIARKALSDKAGGSND